MTNGKIPEPVPGCEHCERFLEDLRKYPCPASQQCAIERFLEEFPARHPKDWLEYQGSKNNPRTRAGERI
jgi:hypothetical protein